MCVEQLATRLTVKVNEQGGIDLPDLDLTPGTELELIIFSLRTLDEDEVDSLAVQASVLAQPALAALWDNPEEDAAWRDL